MYVCCYYYCREYIYIILHKYDQLCFLMNYAFFLLSEYTIMNIIIITTTYIDRYTAFIQLVFPLFHSSLLFASIEFIFCYFAVSCIRSGLLVKQRLICARFQIVFKTLKKRENLEISRI